MKNWDWTLFMFVAGFLINFAASILSHGIGDALLGMGNCLLIAMVLSGAILD